jgi:hypothetical protein
MRISTLTDSPVVSLELFGLAAADSDFRPA